MVADFDGRAEVDFRPALSSSQWLGRRARQEDAFLVDHVTTDESNEAGTLFVVADGMGGEVDGNIASRVALTTFEESFKESPIRDVAERLLAALAAANKAIAVHIENDIKRSGMGTTLLACYIQGKIVYWVSSGDSLLLLFRGGQIKRLNADHSYGALKHTAHFAGAVDVDTPDHALVSALTGTQIKLIDCPIDGYQLLPEDIVIAATDGLETLSEDDVVECLVADNGNSAKGLIDAVRSYDVEFQDNVTVIVASIASSEEGDMA